MTDDQLIDRIREGDASALDDLFDRYYRHIHRFLCSRTLDPHAAGDLTQDVFVRAAAALPRFRQGNFRAWLFTVAHHACLDHFRRSQRAMVRLGTVEEADDAPDPAPGPDEAVERRQAAEEAARLLALLSAPQRDVVVLRVYHELELKEIGQVLGIPLSRVKNRLYAGLERLKKEVARNEDR